MSGFSEALNRVMLLLMLEVHFEMLVEQWVRELQGPFREWVVSLPDCVGKEVKDVRRRHPRLKVFSPPERGEDLAVSWKAKRIELFVFDGGRCYDAFGIPADQIQKVMPQRLYEALMRCLESKKKLKQAVSKRKK